MIKICKTEKAREFLAYLKTSFKKRQKKFLIGRLKWVDYEK